MPNYAKHVKRGEDLTVFAKNRQKTLVLSVKVSNFAAKVELT